MKEGDIGDTESLLDRRGGAQLRENKQLPNHPKIAPVLGNAHKKSFFKVSLQSQILNNGSEVINHRVKLQTIFVFFEHQ